MKKNNRLDSIDEYHFKNLDTIKKQYIESGRKIADLSIGDPDLSVNKTIIDGLLRGLSQKDFNKYPPYEGINELKEEIITYYSKVYSVKLKKDEVLILIGSKEGINNLIPAICGIGNSAIIPTPSYPVYNICCKLWGVNTFDVLLEEKNFYLPDLGALSREMLETSSLFIINYPHNPTGATADNEFYNDLANICAKNDIVLCNDGAYNEIIEAHKKPVSLLQNKNIKNCIELGSFSKTFNMTGFRIGYAVGDAKIIRLLSKVKTNVDSGQFKPIQFAALEAVKLNRDYIEDIRKVYIERRQIAERLLTERNIRYFQAKGTFYIWCKTPGKYSTEEFCEILLDKYGIIVTPGVVFGTAAKEYFRIALTQQASDINCALSNLSVF